MRKSRLSETEIVPAVKQVEMGVPVKEIARKYGDYENTVYPRCSVRSERTTAAASATENTRSVHASIDSLVWTIVGSAADPQRNRSFCRRCRLR